MRPVPAAFVVGLLTALVSSHAPAVAQFGGATEQRVELSSFDFTPRALHLRAGQPYTLVLTNVASGGHDFSAPEFFAAARVQPNVAWKV